MLFDRFCLWQQVAYEQCNKLEVAIEWEQPQSSLSFVGAAVPCTRSANTQSGVYITRRIQSVEFQAHFVVYATFARASCQQVVVP